MVLSNAQRQARYRDRLKLLAANGVMSQLQLDTLSDTRRLLREWRRSLAVFAEGHMSGLTMNGIDITGEHFARVRVLITQNEAFVAKFDPSGLTADGNVEIGDVSPQESGEILPGRWVAYTLDDHGSAINLRFYDGEILARTEAGMAPARYAGVILDDMWSISPPTE